MSESDRDLKHIAVVGGGISGLATAYRLQELEPSWQVTLFEAQSQLGGVIKTVHQDGFCIELGPDSFITQVPWGLKLCERLGFSEELIGTNPLYRSAYVVHQGRLHPLPPGMMIMAPTRIWPLVTSGLFSIRAKLRMGCEYFLPRRKDGSDESLAEFAYRRFGREAFDHLIQPMASGIYMADPRRLSMQAAFPQFVEMECQYRSLIRAARDRARQRRSQGTDSGPRYSLFVAPRQGLGSLVVALEKALHKATLRPNTLIRSLRRQPDGRWRLGIESSAAERKSEEFDFDGVVLATPAKAMSQLLADTDSRVAGTLGEVANSSCIVVTVALSRSQVKHPLDGFGFVVPLCEERDILACTFSSVKYEYRAPDGFVLLRTFLGGACRPETIDRDDDDLTQRVLHELRELIGIHGEPLFVKIQRLPDTMPQYEVGHLDRTQALEAALSQIPHLELAGNAFRGVGIPYCIHTGETAAERIIDSLRSPSHRQGDGSADGNARS